MDELELKHQMAQLEQRVNNLERNNCEIKKEILQAKREIERINDKLSGQSCIFDYLNENEEK